MAVLPGLPAAAQLPPIVDTVSRSVIVERVYNKPMVINSKGISGTVNTDKIAAVPSFLGNADPIRFVRLLPSVQMNTEIEAGIYMQGSEHSHTLVSQAGVPIYGVSHLLGLFSVFNTSHYQGMQYSTTSRQETRMGGMVNMELPDTVAKRLGGDFSLGLLNAQGTLDIPLGASSLKVSARRTYVNLLYGSILKYADFPIRYGFTDANVTWTWKPGRRDKIWADFFACLDDGRVSGATIKTLNARWYNALGAVHWNHYFPEATMKQSAYASTYGMKAEIDAFNIYGQMPSFIRDYGYRNTVQWKDWEFGARYSYYDIQPQNPSSRGHIQDSGLTGNVPRQNAMEAVLSAQYSRILGYWLQLKAGIGLNWYLSPEKRHYWGLTPEVELVADAESAGKFTLRYGLKRQNLFQVGLTNTGLPVEFWLPAGDLQAPQWSHNFSLAYNADFFENAWSVSISTKSTTETTIWRTASSAATAVPTASTSCCSATKARSPAGSAIPTPPACARSTPWTASGTGQSIHRPMNACTSWMSWPPMTLANGTWAAASLWLPAFPTPVPRPSTLLPTALSAATASTTASAFPPT